MAHQRWISSRWSDSLTHSKSQIRGECGWIGSAGVPAPRRRRRAEQSVKNPGGHQPRYRQLPRDRGENLVQCSERNCV